MAERSEREDVAEKKREQQPVTDQLNRVYRKPERLDEFVRKASRSMLRRTVW